MNLWLEIDDPAAVAPARRRAKQAARDLGLSETRQEEAAIAATEAATNVLRHGRGGRFLIQALRLPRGARLVLIAADNGDGIADPGRMMRDGESGSGTAGLGLGGMQRLSDRFDLWTQPGKGTITVCEFAAPGAELSREGVDLAALTVCHPAETRCGDAWSVRETPQGTDVLLCDGLGHGASAAEEAEEVITTCAADSGSPEQVLSRASRVLSGRRGAVASALRIRPGLDILEFGGVGNIATFKVSGGVSKRFPVRDGRLGGPPLHAFGEETTLMPGDLIIMHTDGIATIRTGDLPAGLFSRAPLTIAAALMHWNFRGRDDAGIVVLRVNKTG
ncbi:ATP-binding protein [Leisingera caerulea]|uniref:ATP-binding protein n=1 Tax=Leisingera caerulea TaxID=506591 RepID=A0A9Q9HJI1_LEICA|nr:ATP-binding protein [Leisingera caerulea]UWQ53220.1 ATP-binding protein [Leisingera caerulea]UWQ57737.1 ATP-binding protein [Leisingera caerulea]